MNIRRQTIVTIILTQIILFVGCGEPESPENGIPDVIDNFVAGYDLPDKQETQLRFVSDDKSVHYFGVAYGPGHDCSPSCFYSWHIGVCTKDKIGWILIDTMFLDTTGYQIFEFDSSDFESFNTSLLEEMRADEDFIHYPLTLMRLSVVPGIPLDVQLTMIDYIAYHGAWPIAENLLENPTTLNYPEILQKLACLPGTIYDQLQDIRDRARDILGNQFVDCE